MSKLDYSTPLTASLSPVLENPSIHKPAINHFKIHHERPFLWEERETTTVLMGGLSPTHDVLFEAALKSLGVKAKALPPTTLESFHLGREYGNNGFCNPAYFNVGNLIHYLKDLEKSGLSKEDIIKDNVFFTIGCNAPCRFGTLETEYRMALKDCGFDGFRVLVFQYEGGLNQKVTGNGLDVNTEFFLAVFNALNLADVINELAFATRPFEVIPGKTREVLEKATEFLYQKVKIKDQVRLGEKWDKRFQRFKLSNTMLFIYRFWHQLTSTYYTSAVQEVRKMFEEIEVDRFRSKVTVKITGEFWAVTTVGAGNFNMFNFLEKEGALLLVEPVATITQYFLSKGILRHKNRKKILFKKDLDHRWDLKQYVKNYLGYQRKNVALRLGKNIYRREFARLQKAMGGDHHMLIKQSILQKIANSFYNINIEGGEGYMEIAKNIYYHRHHLAHMVLSLKPFGCMPSTQSDGVQAAVMEMYKGMIFLPVETAGEGETNAQSRVLMSLGDARVKAKKEMQDARNSVTSSMEELRSYVNNHPELKCPTYVVSRKHEVVNMAANFIYHVNDLIEEDRQVT